MPVLSLIKWTSVSYLSLYLEFRPSFCFLDIHIPFFMEDTSREFNSISTRFLAETADFLEKTLRYVSSLCSDPIFSSLVTLYALVLLYFPSHLLEIIFSPVLISTGILLLTLLKLGAIQRIQKELNCPESQKQQQQQQQTNDSPDQDHKWVSCVTNLESNTEVGFHLGFDPSPFYAESFVEWNVRAPLEVIYEEYEGEEGEENNEFSNEKEEKRVMCLERYPSLSLYYPETDSDSSSDGGFPVVGGWDSPENMWWDEEENREGLIEIALDGKRRSEVFHVEEDNLIEIDISPARNDEFSSKKW